MADYATIKVLASGTVTTLANWVFQPQGVAVDSAGNVYFSSVETSAVGQQVDGVIEVIIVALGTTLPHNTLGEDTFLSLRDGDVSDTAIGVSDGVIDGSKDVAINDHYVYISGNGDTVINSTSAYITGSDDSATSDSMVQINGNNTRLGAGDFNVVVDGSGDTVAAGVSYVHVYGNNDVVTSQEVGTPTDFLNLTGSSETFHV